MRREAVAWQRWNHDIERVLSLAAVLRRIGEWLNELDLLEPMEAQVTVGSGERLSLGGFMAISRVKLKALPGEKLAELAKTDELELVYLHLQSMHNFDGLKQRLDGATSTPTGASSANAGDAVH